MGESTLRTLLRIAWRVCWQAGPLLASAHLGLALVGGLLAATAAWSTKLMIDGLVSHHPPSVLVVAVSVLALVGLVSACEPRMTEYLAGELNRRVTVVLNDRLFTAIGTFQGLARFEDPHLLDRIRSAQQATSGAVAPATTGLFGMGRDVIAVVSLLATVLLLSPPMALIMVAAAVPMLFAQLALSRHYAKAMNRMSAKGRQQYQYSSLGSDVQAVKELRLLGLVDFFKVRVLGALVAANDVQRGLDRRTLRVQASLALLSTVISAGGMAWAVFSAYAGRLTVGDVTAFVAAVSASQAALSSFVSKITNAHRALALFGHYVDVVSMPPDLPQPTHPTPLPVLRKGIELRDVWFRYDESHPWVLRGVNVRIDSGSSLALVGLNGAGKSTLVKLLCRFYDPVRGEILWDGVDIRTVPITELRQRMGVLFQDFMEYDLTVAENIGIGELDRIDDRDRVVWAAREAGMAEKVDALPRRYDTLLSRIFFSERDKQDAETGVTLSGGQWQRIALARTFMRAGRDLLILDEPSSGLDAEAEHQIHHRLRAHRQGRTSLLISHRLSAVRDADRIVVLDEGRVVEEGTHAELMRLDGQYARLFSLQAQGYAGSPC